MDKQQAYWLQQMGITVWQERKDEPQESISSSWERLHQNAIKCQKCPLAKTRKHVVFGAGALDARLLIVGEAPGANEDRLGEPFVGKAGQLLNNMLFSIGLSRESVYICNIIKCRPPNNRDPLAEEIAACSGYLAQQIQMLDPKLILAVGRIAGQYLLGTTSSLAKMRQQLWLYEPTKTPLMITYHPAYLLRNLTEKAKSYQDLLKAKSFLDN